MGLWIGEHFRSTSTGVQSSHCRTGGKKFSSGPKLGKKFRVLRLFFALLSGFLTVQDSVSSKMQLEFTIYLGPAGQIIFQVELKIWAQILKLGKKIGVPWTLYTRVYESCFWFIFPCFIKLVEFQQRHSRQRPNLWAKTVLNRTVFCVNSLYFPTPTACDLTGRCWLVDPGLLIWFL